MTCRDTVWFAQGPVRASWLAEDIPLGPRSPRIRSSSQAAYGLVPTTGQSLMPAGLPGMEIRQWLHEQHLLALRDALISTTAKLRREHRASCLAMEQLRAVTNECLAMGGK